jgi:KUP system potassium uptake protein
MLKLRRFDGDGWTMSSISPSIPKSHRGRTKPAGSVPALALAALGVVFGDIGTSPLYTLKIILALGGSEQTAARATALGSLSLIVWSLIVITTIKYVTLALRMDNRGEGGIMALMALLGGRKKKRRAIMAFGLFGAALIYGDGAITPAISVLSALEGLSVLTPKLDTYIVPLTVAILVLLFLVQPRGTAAIGRLFGPIMLVWFLVMGGLGAWSVVQNPAVLAALDPLLGLEYLFSGGAGAFLVLGAVFLCVTGAEALYADMGHFGRLPIQVAWLAIVFPCLVLNYAGQAALVLNGAPASANTFYELCPDILLIPYVLLATVATIIASQAIITGAFSMTRQAIQLNWLPRLRIAQTSAMGYGQIYVGAVNWLLMAATIMLTLLFKKSDNLAAAYGIAVSATMLMTSVLLFIAMREHLRWSLWVSAAISGCFILVDSAFFLANSAKIAEGGYVPLAIAGAIYGLMWVWHTGRNAVMQNIVSKYVPVDGFLAGLEKRGVPRVPGTAVFLTRSKRGVPAVMAWHVRHNRALHEKIFVINVCVEPDPYVEPQDRLHFFQEAAGFWRATANFGFMERPDIPAVLEEAKARGCDILLEDITYYVGHETVVSREDGSGLPGWAETLFAAMERNAAHVTDFFKLPPDQVVEIGRQVAI